VAPLVAGTLGVSPAAFLVGDAIGALAWIVALVAGGQLLHGVIGVLEPRWPILSLGLATVLGVGISVLWLLRRTLR
jgi:membrane protein DedA with SNARE-associated domain